MYKLVPNNEGVEPFPMNAFHWPLILEQCGTYFMAVFRGPRFFYVSGIDERMGDSDEGPAILLNDGFAVTNEEARVMARIVRNYAAMQRALDIGVRDTLLPPLKLNLVSIVEEFAEWAETSGGFQVT